LQGGWRFSDTKETLGEPATEGVIRGSRYPRRANSHAWWTEGAGTLILISVRHHSGRWQKTLSEGARERLMKKRGVKGSFCTAGFKGQEYVFDSGRQKTEFGIDPASPIGFKQHASVQKSVVNLQERKVLGHKKMSTVHQARGRTNMLTTKR